MTARRALVYGDVNMNQIDGSSIWAQSMVEVLALAGCDVTLLLKAPVKTARLIEPLLALPNVRVVRPFEEHLAGEPEHELLSVGQAARIMRGLDVTTPFDLVVLRGSRLVRTVIKGGAFHGRIWAYLTDVPQAVTDLSPEVLEGLAAVGEGSRVVLCQTEELRAFLESNVPEVCGKSVLFPPVIPRVEGVPQRKPPPGDRPLRLVYSGKYAALWKTEEMTTLPAQLALQGVPTELHMIGDKIHHDPNDKEFKERMNRALAAAPGVIWHGGMPRQKAIELAASSDIGMSWRDRRLDASLELSTKVLEYGSVGLPVVLNRTPMHETLLGVDYPLFVHGDQVVEVIDAVAAEPTLYLLAAERCRRAAEDFTQERAVDRAKLLLRRVFPAASALAGRARRLRVGVASHDLKFFSRLLEYLEALPELEVRVDRWASLAEHDPTASKSLAEWADVVICEWCGPNAVWYSQHKRPDQRLIVRLHRFELYGPWPGQLDIGSVDQIVCVSPYYASLTRERTGWPDGKIGVVPNWVDDAQLDRPKLPGARFHLGMIGVGESRKRFDIALDILERLRRRDERFMLFAKTKMPWDYRWIWRRPGEQEHLDTILRRIQTSDELRGAVVFDDFGPDVGTWLRRVGFVLSTSDDESFHLAPAEGMASGAVPVVRGWPGAETIYDPRWIRHDAREMADRIFRVATQGGWEEERRMAREQVRDSFALERVSAMWADLLTSHLPPSSETRTLAAAPAAHAATVMDESAGRPIHETVAPGAG